MSQPQPATKLPARVCSSQRRMDMTARLRRLGGARAAVQMVARATMVQAHEAALLLSGAATLLSLIACKSTAVWRSFR